ncbi:MAG: ATP-binding protein [Planctomycetes bacterium]|nr:ATP-binding protein [Planctomycetota bacterium]
MIDRISAASSLHEAMRRSPAVAILGPRQVGKTTLALQAGPAFGKPFVYLDLERDSDRERLREAELYLYAQAGKMVILDEIQRVPELFPLLRGLIDERERSGERHCQFLVLGSASPVLLRQTSESLAGRIAFLELTPFRLEELPPADFSLERLWERGGFPRSLLAETDEASFAWRQDFVSTFLERDIPQFGLRLSAELLRRFWRMLAFDQGAQLNAARLASSLGVSGNTVRHHLDVLGESFLVRQLPPWSGNSRKRLVKAPKVYIRDSGLAHALAGVSSLDMLLAHPLCGPSFEGFVVEQVALALPSAWRVSYYRSGAGAEADLVLEGPGGEVWVAEIKRTLRPVVGKGFRFACEDVGATAGFFIIPSGDAYPLDSQTQALGLREFLARLAEQVGHSSRRTISL